MSSTVWAKLFQLKPEISGGSSCVTISSSPFVIGRSSKCDLVFKDNALISARHCSLARNADGSVSLSDTSNNGTFLNDNHVMIHWSDHQLANNDVIHLVRNAKAQSKNLCFKIELLNNETTQPVRQESECSETMRIEDVVGPSETQNTEQATDQETAPRKSEPPPAVTSTKRRRRSNISLTTREESSVNPHAKIARIEEPQVNKTNSGNMDVEQTMNETDSKANAECTTEKVKATVAEEDPLAENMRCSICVEIIHDCISLQPCMHSFCAGCYSDWMTRSKICPECRVKVTRICRNHMLNNIILTYLKQHSDQRRPPEDIAFLESQNKITKDMLYPPGAKNKASQNTEEEYYSGASDESYDSGGSDVPYVPPVVPPRLPVPGGYGALYGGIPPIGYPPLQPAVFRCRQCPNYAGPYGFGPNAQGGGAGVVEEYKTLHCPQQLANHIVCQCCMQPMPDMHQLQARLTGADAALPPPVLCRVCSIPFCHMYWTCRKPGCKGCINKFTDLTFGPTVMDNIVLDNPVESKILSDYLTSEQKDWKTLLTDCCTKVLTDEFVLTTIPSVDAAVCFKCGLKEFKQLALQYRKTVPDTDFPAAVRSKPKCHWGSDCWTQRTKPAHAE